MKKLTAVRSILEVLARSNNHLTIPQIVTELENEYSHEELKISKDRVKRYLNEIQDDMDYRLDVKRGNSGGYALHEDTWRSLAEISNLRLTSEERNALNDSFEIAEKSSTYYYLNDLKRAWGKLYLKMNLKDQDYEYYVGKQRGNETETLIIKKLKKAMMNSYKINMTSKYEYFNIPKKLLGARPLYLIHDNDESFLVLLDEKGEYLYQNILNINNLDITDNKFIRLENEKIESHKNEYTISIKPTTTITFKIITNRGQSIFNLWNYQFEDKSKSEINKKIIFYEEYKVYEFLFRMQPHVENLKIDNKKVVDGWNKRIKKVKII